MTVFRALRGAACAVFVPVAVTIAVIIAVMIAVPTVRQVSAADSAGEASTPTTQTTLLVASEGPTPGVAVAGAPRVGPLDPRVGGNSGHGVWWLFALGALQVVGLFVMTRRRARLSSPDTAS